MEIAGPAVPGAGVTGGVKLGTAPKDGGGAAVPGGALSGKLLLGKARGNVTGGDCAATAATATSTAKPATNITPKRITGNSPTLQKSEDTLREAGNSKRGETGQDQPEFWLKFWRGPAGVRQSNRGEGTKTEAQDVSST